jgi:hypothetical protein
MPSIDLFHPLRYWNDEPLVIPEITSNDARLDREDSLSDRYAFSLGEELGVHRLTPSQPLQHPEMERGYRFGLGCAARHASIARRKLLQVRRSAFDRGIPVSTALNEQYLRDIIVTVCPVSGVELTQGTLEESDWSLDRLDNELGYVPGNVCFVASRVNSYKSADNFSDLAAHAVTILLRDGPEGLAADVGNGLMVIEALRLAALMAAPSGLARGLIESYAPFAMAPGVWSTVEASVAGVHVACARERIEGRGYRRRRDLFRHQGSDVWRNSTRLVEIVRRGLASGTHPCDVWFDGDAIERLKQLSASILSDPPDIPGVTDKSLSEAMDATRGVREYQRRR